MGKPGLHRLVYMLLSGQRIARSALWPRRPLLPPRISNHADSGDPSPREPKHYDNVLHQRGRG